ncbi:unnamed protein product [Lymnaea stagnalis]|uniref:Uncharacterized protein n=1 Tax=Lymnaea stagnalis TaxID=6523 RepID=A0AAV2HEI3_LYMST
MATGHILPGYGQTVTNLRRARSAGRYPLDTFALLEFQKSSRLSQHEFDQIRANARQLWSNRTPKPTTYDTYFSGGEILEITQAQVRPTSGHRRNNPHPPQIFLTNRLHYIGNADKTQEDKEEDNPATKEEKLLNQRKYVGHYDSAFLNQYKDTNGFKNILPPRQAQAAEAWVKLADDIDKERVFDIVRDHEDWKSFQEEKLVRRPKTAYPSLQRWMKFSGAEENEATSQTMMKSNPLIKYEDSSYYDQKRRDSTSAGQTYQYPRIRRGDYSIHPGWPSSLPHHRVP